MPYTAQWYGAIQHGFTVCHLTTGCYYSFQAVTAVMFHGACIALYEVLKTFNLIYVTSLSVRPLVEAFAMLFITSHRFPKFTGA